MPPALMLEAWLCLSTCGTAEETWILPQCALIPEEFSLGQVKAWLGAAGGAGPCQVTLSQSGLYWENRSLGGTAWWGSW